MSQVSRTRTDRLRVLVVSTRYPDTDAPNLGNFVEREARALSETGNADVRVVAARNADVLPRVEDWKGLTTWRMPVRGLDGPQEHRPRRLARALLPLLADLQREDPFDVISAEFAWPEGPAVAAIGRALRVPVLVKARGMDFERRLSPEPVRRRLLAGARAAAGLVAVSNDMRETMVAAGVDRSKILVLHAGVDADRFIPSDREALKATLGVDGPLLLCVGNLIPIKGQDIAITALREIPGARLFIVGDGPEAGALRRLAEELGVAERVRFLGSLPNVLLPKFYAAADVTVHASRMEGFPNVRLESLACGTPLVTTSVGDAAALLRTTSAGRIVAPDSAAVADAVRSLLSDPPAPETVRAAILEFTWKRAAEQLSAILASIVESGA